MPIALVRDLPPSMGAEDFSFMLQARPGAYLRLGQGGADEGIFLHNTRYDFNDDVLADRCRAVRGAGREDVVSMSDAFAA